MSGSSIRRSMRSRSRVPSPIARSFSSPSASRPPRRPTPWRSTAPIAREYEISRCWSRMCWCRRRCARLLDAPTNRVQGFLAAGHVCTVMGYEEYEPIAARYRVPIVVTGFEPLDILEGVHMCVRQLEQGRGEVENQYSRSVRREGNRPAQEVIREVFQIVPRRWRGIGEIAQSGLGLSDAYRDYDAEIRFGRVEAAAEEEARMHQRPRTARRTQAVANAPLSARAARLSGRSASRWFPARAPAPPITAIAGRAAR